MKKWGVCIKLLVIIHFKFELLTGYDSPYQRNWAHTARQQNVLRKYPRKVISLLMYKYIFNSFFEKEKVQISKDKKSLRIVNCFRKNLL